jgi:hypothetical protein
MQKNTYFLLALLLVLMSGCEPEINSFAPHSGDADFSAYVSIGCSKTAGFTNNELFRSGQIVSFPNIISRQLLHVGGGEFRQPLMHDELGFGNKVVLGYKSDCDNDSVLAAISAGGMADESNFLNMYAEQGPFHNMGVPFARISDLTNRVDATQNLFFSYFSRFAKSPTSSVMDDVLSLNPSFFSLWIGAADIYLPALSPHQPFEIISKTEFDSYFTQLLINLSQKVGQGIVATIPDITDFPYFTHVRTQNIWVVDELANNGKRLLLEHERILLSAETMIKCENVGSDEYPLPREYYLSENQVNLLKSRVGEFNKVITERAKEFDFALVNLYELFKSLAQTNLVYDGLFFNSNYIYGSFYSIDGQSLTPRANAIIANAFLQAINEKYNAAIPLVSIAQFQSIEFP